MKTLNKELKTLKLKLNICKPIAMAWTILVSPLTFVVGGFKSTLTSIDETKNMLNDLSEVVNNLEEAIKEED